jgi:hypothetical protein
VHRVQSGANALENDLTELMNRLNRAGTKALLIPGDYLEIVITKR